MPSRRIAAGDAGGEVVVHGVEALLGGFGRRARRRPRGARRSLGSRPAAGDDGGDQVLGAAAAMARPPTWTRFAVAVERLCAPLDPDTRRAVATGAARAAVQLAALAPSGAAAAARRAADAFALLADGGPDAPRMTAALAGDLIDLRALERAPAPDPAAPSGAQARGERSIRAASTLDSTAGRSSTSPIAEAAAPAVRA